MLNRLKTWSVAVGAVQLGLSSTACAQLSPATLVPRLGGSDTSDPTLDPSLTTQASPTVAVSTSATPQAGANAGALGPSNAAVHKGSIDLQLTLTGRVAGAEEQEIAYPSGGKVQTIAVRAGETVQEGQLLLQTESDSIQKDLDAAQARLETASLRLQQSQAQTASQRAAAQRDASRRTADEVTRRQQAIQDAQVALNKARDDYDRVAAGPSSTEKRIAEATLANAQSVLAKATADLDRLNRGANSDDVHAAEASLASAQTNVDTAQAEVDRLTRGPDPAAVRAAERDVERAQTALKVAQSTKADGTNVTQTQRDALIANAQLAQQDAEDRLAKIKAPSDPKDVTIAQRNLQVAKTAADQARARLDLIKKGPDQATLDAAQQAVDAAQTAVDNAQDKLDDTNGHPTAAELRAAQDRVDQAQAALTRAMNAPSSVDAPTDDGSSAFDLEIMQKALAQEQSNVSSLQKKLEDTKLLAPFAGVVTTINVKAGDPVDPAHPAMTMSRPGQPVIRIDLTEQDAAKLKEGQPATITLDGATLPLNGTVGGVGSNPNGSGRVAHVRVDWGSSELPKVGRTAQVGVTLQHKDNVLLVPKKAVRTAGPRTYVQFMSGSSRRIANVEVGITTDQDAEITSGLTEGQIVVVGP